MLQIAAGCALFEAVVAAYLVTRNCNYDRFNAAFLVPFLFQSSMQALIYLVLDDTSDGVSCGRWSKNWLFSFMQVIFISGVPYFWAWVSFVECTLLVLSSDPRESDQKLRQLMRMLNLVDADISKVWPRRTLVREILIPKVRYCAGNGSFYLCLTFLFFAVRSCYPTASDWESWNLSWLVPGSICTTRGQWGFQVVPIAEFAHWSLKYIVVLGFWFCSTAYNCIPHPSLMPFAVELCGCLGFLAIIFIDAQWTSLWSLGAVGMYLVAIVEPSIFKKGRVLDPEALDPMGDELRHSYLFNCAWSRFSMYKAAPWSERAQCVEDPVRDEDAKKTEEAASCILSVPTLMTMGDMKPGKPGKV